MSNKYVNNLFLKKYGRARQQVMLSYLLKGVSVLISLLYVPTMLTYLTREQFGVWVAISSIVAWIRLFNFGVAGGLRFYLSSAIAIGDIEKSKKLISTTYFSVGVIFFIVWVLFCLVNPFIHWPSLLNSKLIEQSQYVRIMFLAVSCFIVNLILDIVRTIYEANGKSSVGNILQILSSLLTLIGVFVLSHFTSKNNLESAILVVLASPIIVNFVATIVTFKYKFPSLSPHLSDVQFDSSRELFNLSLKFFVLQITSTIIYVSVPFVIARLYGPGAVTNYHVASSIFNLPILMIGLFTTPLIPFITQEYAKKNYEWVKSNLKKSMLLATGIILFTVLLIVFSSRIYKVWLGDQVEIPSDLSLAIGVYTILNVFINPLSTFMNAIGKIDKFVKFTPLELLLYFASVFLFHQTIGNVVGVVIALAVTSIVGLILQPIILKKYLGINRSSILDKRLKD